MDRTLRGLKVHPFWTSYGLLARASPFRLSILMPKVWIGREYSDRPWYRSMGTLSERGGGQ